MGTQSLNITPLGTVSYNGYEFDECIHSSIEVKNVENDAGTGLKGQEHTLTITAVIHPTSMIQQYTNDVPVSGTGNTTTEYNLNAIRTKLMEPRKRLEFSNKGFGTFGQVIVADSDTVTSLTGATQVDMNFGPKPKTLSWVPIGGNRAARIVWSITWFTLVRSNISDANKHTMISFTQECNATFNKAGFADYTLLTSVEFNLNTTTEIRKHDLMSTYQRWRTTWKKNNDAVKNAHLESSVAFHPNGQSAKFTEHLTQIESYSAFPTGVVEISAPHRVKSSLMGGELEAGFQTWMNNLNVKVQLKKGVPKIRAWTIFLAIAGRKIAAGIQTKTEETSAGEIITRLRLPFILSMEFEDDEFSMETGFEISWVTYCKNLHEIFSKSSMLNQAPEGNWNTWYADMRDATQRWGGSDGLWFDPESKVIVNANNQIKDNTNLLDRRQSTSAPNVSALIFNTNCPPEESSWVSYTNKFMTISNKGDSSYLRYPEAITRKEPDINSIEGGTRLNSEYNNDIEQENYIIQDFGNDTHFIVMRGAAVRLGRSTQPPIIKYIGGQRVRLHGKAKINNTVKSSDAACPVYVTTWEITYEVMGYTKKDLETDRKTSGEKGQH